MDAPLEEPDVASRALGTPSDSWLVTAGDLLRRPDPGPVEYLVDGLITTTSLTAAVGRWKTGKSWALTEMAISIAAGVPALGGRDVRQGTVVYLNEESGELALQRRIAALARGRDLDPDRLDALHLAPNRGVRLDDEGWQYELFAVGLTLRPVAFIFDPIARMKSSERDESSQRDIAPVIEFLRELRDLTGAAVIFVQHTGHHGEHMRGTSDLETVWEDRLHFTKRGDMISVSNEHREDEPSKPIALRLAWNSRERSMRLRPTAPPLVERILEFVDVNPLSRVEEIARAVDTRTDVVRQALGDLVDEGVLEVGRSGRADKRGRPIADKAYRRPVDRVVSSAAEMAPSGTTQGGSSASRTDQAPIPRDPHGPRPIEGRPDAGRPTVTHGLPGDLSHRRPLPYGRDDGTTHPDEAAAERAPSSLVPGRDADDANAARARDDALMAALLELDAKEVTT